MAVPHTSDIVREVIFSPLEHGGRTQVVFDRLRNAVALDVFKDGEQLPPETELAAQLGISPVTLRDALGLMREAGLVETRRGRTGGSFVRREGYDPVAHGRSRLEALTLVERLHRRLLDVIKDEFDRRGRADINSVQALLLYNIGDKELTAGELRTRGYYLGSNVSYNLKKLVEMAFLDHQRSRVDRRSVRIKLTDKGREVRDIVETLYQKHVRTVEQVGGINADEFATLNKSLHRLERFWTDQILYRL